MRCPKCGHCTSAGPSGVAVIRFKCAGCGTPYEIRKYASSPDPYLPTLDGQPPRPYLFPEVDTGQRRKGFFRRSIESIFAL